MNLDGAKKCIECGEPLRSGADRSETGGAPDDPSRGTSSPPSHAGAILAIVTTIGLIAVLVMAFAAGGRMGGGGGGSVASTGTPPPTGAHTQAAQNAATALDGAPVSLTFVETSPYIGGQAERYSSAATSTSGVDYYFDSRAGRIVRRDDFSTSSGRSTVSMRQAQQAAEAFALKNVPFFGQSGMVLRSSGGAGGTTSSPSRYAFYWVKQDPVSGAVLPTFLGVEVDAVSGSVKSFSSADASVTISTVPKVSKADAVASASKGLSGATTRQVPTADLFVGTVPVGDPGGQQTLLWVIGISATDSSGALQGGRVYINAMTGEVVSVDRLN